jgi:BirA family transcriptional regulator, biotin operon repressor / biotin---[acetyl-CoA-carboxylase] ligase
VTRTTIWGAIQEAQTYGIEIFSVRGRGYRLPDQLHLLDSEKILTSIGPERNWFRLEIHDCLESTNSYLMKKANPSHPSMLGKSQAAHATCVVAELQTAGKGRRGRTWVSSLGSSLTFSLLWRFQSGAAALSGLSLVVGVGIVRALRALGIDAAKLKWPNDILIHSQDGMLKLAGILIELQGDMEGPSAAVIGIGLNLNLSKQTQQKIDQPFIDLQTINKDLVDPNLLLGTLLKYLAEVLKQFEDFGFEFFQEEWVQYHAYHESPVKLLLPDGRDVRGHVSGVTHDGRLVIQTAQGEQRFSSGEISLRGLT